MKICREAIINAIAKAAQIPQDQVTDLKLQPGLNLLHYENLFDLIYHYLINLLGF